MYDRIRRFSPEHIHAERPCFLPITGAIIDAHFSVQCEIDLNFALHGVDYTHTFVVVAGLTHYILLGFDFKRLYVTRMDHVAHQLVLRTKDGTSYTVPFFIGTDSDELTSLVRVVGEHTIPPHTAKLIPVQTRKHIPNCQIEGIFIPQRYQNQKYRLTGAEILRIRNHSGLIRFENPTDEPLIVRSVNIGHFTEIRYLHGATFEQTMAHELQDDHLGLYDTPPPTVNATTASNGNITDRTSHSYASDLPPHFTVEEHLTDAQRKRIEQLVMQYRDAFMLHEHDIGLTHLLEHIIELTDSTPIHIRQFPLDLEKEKALREFVDKLVAQSKLENSISPWNTPAFVVRKPKGGWRLVNDFRQLNTRTKKMEWPLPNIEHAVNALGGNSYFACLDLSDAFFQIPIKQEHREYTAFNAGGRHVQYTVMPMGLCNATATFQRLISTIFADIDWLRPYVDDIIIPAKTFDELMIRTELVFQRLRQAGLKMGGKKTKIGVTEVEYLGYICDANGIRMNPKKIETVQNYPRPHTVTDLRSFLGLCSSLRRFIRNHAQIAHPLSRQSGGPKHKVIIWSPETVAAFDSLKAALSDPSQVLAYPDFGPDHKPFIIEVDACKVSEGAILMQEQNGVERVISYASRCFSPSERAWPITEQEAHAIFWAVNKQFRWYVRSSPKAFHVRTDHKPCLAMKTNKVAAERMYRWALALQDYNMEIFHVSGKKHERADAISRLGYLIQHYESGFLPTKLVGSLYAADSIIFTPGGTASAHTQNTHEYENYSDYVHVFTCTIDEHQSSNFNQRFPVQRTTAEINVSSLFHDPIALQYLRTQTTDPKLFTIAALSVSNVNLTLNALSGAGYQHDGIMVAQRSDPSTADLYRYLHDGTLPTKRKDIKFLQRISRPYYMDDNVIYRRGGVNGRQLLVPACLHDQLLASVHDAPSAGHFGVQRTLMRLAKNYWWPGMSKDVLNYVRSCTQCQARNVPPHMRSRDWLVKDPIPKLFARISVDIQGEFTTSKNGNRWLVTFMDVHSRWIEGFAINDISALTIAKLLVKEIILRYGAIGSLLSDRGSNFLSEVIRELCKIFRIQKVDIAAYHPESNANIERVHRIYSDMLSKYVNDEHDDWDEIFPFVQWAYRTSYQSALEASPYQLVFGRDNIDLHDIALLGPIPAKISKDYARWYEMLKQRIEKAQTHTTDLQRKINEYHEQIQAKRSQRKLRTFKEGDTVLIRNHVTYGIPDAPLQSDSSTLSIKQKTKKKGSRLTRKWQPRFIGPYMVIQRKGESTYEVCSKADDRDKRVVSIDDIKEYHPRVLRQPRYVDLDTLPLTGDSHGWDEWTEQDDQDEAEITAILNKRVWGRGTGPNEIEYLVQYKDDPAITEWIRERDLFAPELIAAYQEQEHTQQLDTQFYRTTRKGTRKRALTNA
jgi:transposase InsO family protein